MTAAPVRLCRRAVTLLRRGAAWLDDYRYIVLIQLGARLRPEPPREFAQGDLVPILLLPGIYESWHALGGVARELNRLGHPVVVVPELGRNLGALRTSARTVARRLSETDGDEIVIVAHSKGGLIGKALMIGPLGPRVLGMVAVATPFAGSRYARWFPGPGVRTLSDRDPFVSSLGRRRGVDARIVSIYASFDPHIPGGSELAGATNVVVDTVGPVRGDAPPEVRHAVRESVARLSAPR